MPHNTKKNMSCIVFITVGKEGCFSDFSSSLLSKIHISHLHSLESWKLKTATVSVSSHKVTGYC